MNVVAGLRARIFTFIGKIYILFYIISLWICTVCPIYIAYLAEWSFVVGFLTTHEIQQNIIITYMNGTVQYVHIH